MGRSNKTIAGAFTTIVGNDKEKSAYGVFIEHGGKLNQESPELKGYVDEYTQLVGDNVEFFEKLAKLEVVIMQLRSQENIPDIKLSMVRDHIYARAPFYRNNSTANDIRVIVGKTDVWGDNMNELMNNIKFMNKAISKLDKVMNDEIQLNIHKL
jgi:hypothetical protein